MSSSCRKAVLRTSIRLGIAGLAVAAAPIGAAHAADTYVKPTMDLRYEWNDNFGLDPDGGSDSEAEGYIADVEALIGIATPRSNTSLRPRVRYQDYSGREVEKFEAFLDLRSDYQWERAQLLTTGRYSRQDSYKADQQGGVFDPDDPGQPTDPGSTNNTVGEVRTRYQIAPELTFEVTERTSLGGSVEYQAVRFDSDEIEERDDYNYVGGTSFASFALDQRSDLRVGAYANRYEITDGSTETDALGGLVAYRYRWSEKAGLEANLTYEQNDQTDYFPVPNEESSSNWGGAILGYWRGEVSSWRFSLGRSIVGTGARSKSELDELRVQYEHNLTQRVVLTGVGRLQSRNSISTGDVANNRDFARGDLALRWMMNPTWYVQAGYSYIWEDRETEVSDAANNRVFVSFGYEGLGRQRR